MEDDITGVKDIVYHWVAHYEVLLTLIWLRNWDILFTKVDSVSTDITFRIISLFEEAFAAINTDNVFEAHSTKDLTNLSFATSDIKYLCLNCISAAEATDKLSTNFWRKTGFHVFWDIVVWNLVVFLRHGLFGKHCQGLVRILLAFYLWWVIGTSNHVFFIGVTENLRGKSFARVMTSRSLMGVETIDGFSSR